MKGLEAEHQKIATSKKQTMDRLNGLTREKFLQSLGEFGKGIDVNDKDFYDKANAALKLYDDTLKYPQKPKYGGIDLLFLAYPPQPVESLETMIKKWTPGLEASNQKALEVVRSAAERANAKSEFIIIPQYPDYFYEEYKTTTFHVDVGNGELGFTLFLEPVKIGDIIEDRAKTASEQEVLDYYNVIQEIQKPGSTQVPKWIRLYTARPTKDRKFYETATSLPHGVFLGTDESSVEGLAGDLGNDERRDIWFGMVDARNLVMTREHGRNKDYMVSGSAAIKGRLELVTPGK